MTRLVQWLRALPHRRPSRIGLRLLAFNLLVLFVPVAGLLYLDVYEEQLLAEQERGMVQQARILAAALGGAEVIDTATAMPLIARTGERTEARLRVYNERGEVVADSARLGQPPPPPPPREYGRYVPGPAAGIRSRLLYRAGAWLGRTRDVVARYSWRALARGTTVPSAVPPTPGLPPEVRAALDNKYGAAARPTAGQRSLTLYSALPIRTGDRVVGAAVVSQSTFRLLQALYAIRLRLFEIVVLSFAAATVLTAAASRTIVGPIVRLRRTAVDLSERRARLPGAFVQVKRRDEIGDLARALEELARRLDAHITLLESFAADVSHEFKNPLAAMRTAAETIDAAESDAVRRKFVALLLRDVDRLERLVSGVRELARIDAQLAHERLETIDAGALVAQLIDGLRLTSGSDLRFTAPARAIRVRASGDRLRQVIENVIGNASSLTPPGGRVDVAVATEGGRCVITVDDEGPGIPEAHLDRIFERFFTYRPDGGGRDHAGLGLAIARAIVEGYGGTIAASNRHGGGARFVIALPSAPFDGR